MARFETFRELYESIPAKSKYRKAASLAHGFGHDEGYDEARAEFLFKFRELVIEEVGDLDRPVVLEWIEARLEKLRESGRMPSGFDRDAR